MLGADPEIKQLMEDEKLIAIAKDLVETVRKYRTHDWDKKVQAQARMRLYIKKVLRNHGYPPNKRTKKQSKTSSNKQNSKLWGCVNIG